MLDENAVIDAMVAHLTATGHRITGRCSTTEQGIDVVAETLDSKDAVWVEAKGGTSSRADSNRFGKQYNSSQVLDRVAKGFYTAVCLRARAASSCRVILVMPETLPFRKYLSPLAHAATQQRIELLLVTEERKVVAL